MEPVSDIPFNALSPIQDKCWMQLNCISNVNFFKGQKQCFRKMFNGSWID